MSEQVQVKTANSMPLVDFLTTHDFLVEPLSDTLFQVTRNGEFPVMLKIAGGSMFFEVDLGNIAQVGNEDLYFQLLDLNTEILPVSVGINRTNPADPKLVLVESRETKNLDENELLSVFSALEIATDKVAAVLADHVK